MIQLPTWIELRAVRVAEKSSCFVSFVNELRKVLSGPLGKLQVRTQRDFEWRRLHQKCHWHELTCRGRFSARSLLKRAGGISEKESEGPGSVVETLARVRCPFPLACVGCWCGGITSRDPAKPCCQEQKHRRPPRPS